MIRPLIKSDVDDLLDLGKDFWQECSMSITGNFPRNVVYRRLYSGILENKIFGWCYEKENKIISAAIFTILENFWTQESQMSELAWFCKKNQRGSLSNLKILKTAEKYAKEKKIKLFCMGRISGTNTFDKLHEFYLKNGFFFLESTYLKVL